jgi:hypothetical protein
MPYTLWYCGVLIGETDFEEGQCRPPQYAGVFRPTEYGRAVFPRLTGILTAAAGLKAELEARGLSDDEMTAEQVEDLLDNTRAGNRVLDIGKALSEVELRDPGGAVREFKQIAFIDLAELAALSRKLGCNREMAWESLPPEAPQYIVSVTLRTRNDPREGSSVATRDTRLPRLGPRHN